ncbi:MAG: (Fe-S)-binding protein [bacterium]
MAKTRDLFEQINPEIRELLLEMGAKDIFKCYQCGKCASTCPWFQVGTYDFPVYRTALEAVLGTLAASEDKEALSKEIDKVYRCVGCEACVDQCPHGVNIPVIFRAARRVLVDFGSYPEVLRSTVRRIRDKGNPLGENREKRTEWLEKGSLPSFQKGMDFLYFAGCIPAYDQRARKVAQATHGLLTLTGAKFGILGADENCCCEIVRRIGAEGVFQELARANIDAFTSGGVEKIFVTCPHCYDSFKNEYPDLGSNFEVLHSTQYLLRFVSEGKIRFKREFEKKVVYHDPCVLGRQNKIYDEPRELLRAVPGLELIEVEDFNRSLSVCCGAGSGGLWMEWDKDERIATVRAKQLISTGADVIAVACPYCLQMLEETTKSLGSEILVMDIAEILATTCL